MFYYHDDIKNIGHSAQPSDCGGSILLVYLQMISVLNSYLLKMLIMNEPLALTMVGVQLAISTLIGNKLVDNLSWDVGILKLVDETNNPIEPVWSTHTLSPDPDCSYCNSVQKRLI